jgi:hypothetical protein
MENIQVTGRLDRHRDDAFLKTMSCHRLHAMSPEYDQFLNRPAWPRD